MSVGRRLGRGSVCARDALDLISAPAFVARGDRVRVLDHAYVVEEHPEPLEAILLDDRWPTPPRRDRAGRAFLNLRRELHR